VIAGTFAASRSAGTVAENLSEAPTITGARDVARADTEVTVLQTDSLIIRAMQDAEKFHRNQTYKWKPVPVMRHVMRVTARVMTFADVTVSEVTGTAWHDVAEDCCRDKQAQDSVYRLHEDRYGRESVLVMQGLTNPSVFSKAPRAERKKMDFAHLGRQPVKVKRIKAVDRIDNLTETVLDLMSGIGASPRFAMLYADESEALAAVLAGIDLDLISELKEVIREVRRVASTIMGTQT
jgi:hypothetical protein